MTSLFPGLSDAAQKTTQLSVKSPLRYPGGKTRAIKTLAALVPDDVIDNTDAHILSPFVGGGSFELWLTAQGKTVRGFDAFAQLAVFWNQCQHRPQELSAALSALQKPGLGSETFKSFQADLRAYEASPDDSALTELEVATRFFAVNRSSFSGSTLSGGFSSQAAEKRFTASSVEKVAQWHNPRFIISHGDAFDILDDSALIAGTDFVFLDPPYALGGAKDKLYGDNGSTHSGFDHPLLKQKLDALDAQGIRFLLTYNDSEDIRSLYADYHLLSTSWAYGMNASKKSSELIIANYPLPVDR